MSTSNRTGIGPDSGLEPIPDLVEDVGASLIQRKGDGKTLEENGIFFQGAVVFW
jgi:hypothetical protein